jgi:hypothetical protein
MSATNVEDMTAKEQIQQDITNFLAEIAGIEKELGVLRVDFTLAPRWQLEDIQTRLDILESDRRDLYYKVDSLRGLLIAMNM